MPPPGALREFEAIHPGTTERLLAMVEKEQAHRIRTEELELQSEVRFEARGQWMGLLIYGGSTAAAIGSVPLGAHPVVSVAFISVPLVGVIKAFLQRRGK